MKKLLFSTLFSCLMAAGLWAQLPVSTSPENKNVVLEEYTGIYCTWCPDGHKRANNLQSNNPDDVVLINIHRGGYANPSGGDPDYRTTKGTLMTNGAGITGYPAGSINRRVFPNYTMAGGSAMSRGDWASAASVIMAEPSYVNMAMEGFIDLGTSELTVDVEMYFTDQVPDEVRLFVVLMQSNIEGPQTGMSKNPAQVMSNGKYNHNHMFRDVITSRFGDVIDTTNGSLVTMSYTYTLPDDIKGVTVVPQDMEIAGFIIEGNDEIITGVNGAMSADFIGIEETELANEVSFYPNPAQDKLRADFDLNEQKEVRISINDLSGKSVLTLTDQNFTQGKHQNIFDISGLAPGAYILKTKIGANTSTEKLLVQ